MTQVRFSAPRSIASLTGGFLLLMAFAACNTHSYHRPSLESATAPRPVAMKGESRFFDGQIVATLSISRGFEREGEGQGENYRRPRNKDEEIDLPSPSDKEYGENMTKIMMLQIRGSPLPPVTLRINLANQTKQPQEVEFIEFNSDLGNFAVQPAKLSLGAEQAAEPYAMHSQLGVASAEIPVKVALRIDGKTESQVILVKDLFTPEGKRK